MSQQSSDDWTQDPSGSNDDADDGSDEFLLCVRRHLREDDDPDAI
jgi:hypothetical protein